MVQMHFVWKQQGRSQADLEYLLQAASKARFANRNSLCNKAVSIRKPLHFFNKIATPVAWPLATERFTKPIWTLWMFIFAGCFDLPLAPPSQINWLNPWHEILHDWNARVARYVGLNVVEAELATILAFVCICARTLLVYLTFDGYHEFWLGDPGILENLEHHCGCGIPPRNPSVVGKV